MKGISSYKNLVRRKKEIQLQKTFLWEEIAHLHEHDEERGTSYWVQRLLTIDPAVLIRSWEILVKVSKYFSKSKEQGDD